MAQVKFKLRLSEKQNAKASIIAVLYISDAVRPERATGEKVLPEHWNGSRVMTKDKHYPDINRHLAQLETDLMELWRNNKGADTKTIGALMEEVIKGKPAEVEKKSLWVEAYSLFLEYCQSEKDRKTYRKFLTLEVRLKEFEKRSPFDLDTIDFNFYDGFKKYLYSIPNPNYKDYSLSRVGDSDTYDLVLGTSGIPVGLLDDTVYKYVVNIQTFLGWAEKRGYKVNQSYKEWEIIRRTHLPISLTLDELESLEASAMPKDHLSIARDYLALESRMGARISDLQRFDIKAVDNNVWKYTPIKGSRLNRKTVELPFVGYTERAWWILQKYDFRLPKISEQKLNKAIKKACKIAKIDGDMFIERWAGSKRIRIHGKKYEFISTHTGKKTFITILASKGVDLPTISQLTGTTIQTIIKNYLGKLEVKTVADQLNKAGGSKSQSLLKVV